MTRVVIPVFNAVPEFRNCLASLLRNIDASTAITLIDDASTDVGIAPAIDAFVREHANTTVMRNAHNLGFVATVNRAMHEQRDDVLLLNTDTLTTHGFLKAIERCAAQNPNAATITPFSNNAEICSFPEFCKVNPVPDDPELVAAAFAAEPDGALDIPTGVGFCLWIRRAALDQVGDLDAATFGRGYGEENDFCQRAVAHGWRNLVCFNAYVAHVGHASFAATGNQPGGENLQRLSARYPRYNAAVAEFIARDPLSSIRARVAARLNAKPP